MGDLSPGLYQYRSSKLHVIGNVNSTSLKNKQGAGKGPTAWLQHPAAPTPSFCRSVGFSEAVRESGGEDSKDSPEAMVSQEEQAVKKISAWKMPTRRMKKKDEKEQDANKREPLVLPLEAGEYRVPGGKFHVRHRTFLGSSYAVAC